MTNFFGRLFGEKKDAMPSRDVAALVAPLSVPAIHLVKVQQPTRSHVGGHPNLPDGVPWPKRNGSPLGFLARLCLTDIQAAVPIDWLPKTGSLLFFYDIENQPWGFDPSHRGSAAVLLVPDTSQPVSTLNGEAMSGLPRRDVALRSIKVPPPVDQDSIRAMNLSDKEADTLSELCDGVFQGEPKHQVSGFPSPVQSDEMELECQLVTNGLYCGDSSGYRDPRAQELKAGAENWKLLLQFDGDDELGVMWGDAGIIYFWVEQHAARAGDFSNAGVILQCC